jgi:hypothetical protein
MERTLSRAALLAAVAIALAGCTQSGGGAAKVDLTQIEDNQVALNVEGMV